MADHKSRLRQCDSRDAEETPMKASGPDLSGKELVRLKSGYSDVEAIVGRKGRKGLQQMLTPAQQHAVHQFAKSLLALSDDALIDTYHQAADDHRAAQAERSDNLGKAYAQTLATEERDRFPDYRTRYKLRYP
jgi:hypothetical protein